MLEVIRIRLLLRVGGIAIPIAHLVPTSAAGSVQFKDGTTNLGAPVHVIAGIAVGPLSILRPGQHSLTAVFTPTHPAKFPPSTSNKVTFRLLKQWWSDAVRTGRSASGS